jgi:hypothetical protein
MATSTWDLRQLTEQVVRVQIIEDLLIEVERRATTARVLASGLSSSWIRGIDELDDLTADELKRRYTALDDAIKGLEVYSLREAARAAEGLNDALASAEDRYVSFQPALEVSADG